MCLSLSLYVCICMTCVVGVVLYHYIPTFSVLLWMAAGLFLPFVTSGLTLIICIWEVGCCIYPSMGLGF